MNVVEEAGPGARGRRERGARSAQREARANRVQQILDQVVVSIGRAADRLQQALVEGATPDATEWTALLSDGYTTNEQRAVNDGQATAGTAGAQGATTFF